MSIIIASPLTRRVYVSKTCTHIAANIDPSVTYPVPECSLPALPNHNYCEHHYAIMFKPAKKMN